MEGVYYIKVLAPRARLEPVFHRKTWFPLLFILSRGSTSRFGDCVSHDFFKKQNHHKFQHFNIICCSYLQELCLHTKLLAPVNCPIADFLMKAPEPPPALIVRNAVHMLKVRVFIVFTLLILLEI